MLRTTGNCSRGIELNADGLERVRRVTIKAGDFEESDNVVEGSVQLTLETQGQPPGLVELRLSELKTGSVLILQSSSFWVQKWLENKM